MEHKMERQIIDAASGEVTILEIDAKGVKEIIGEVHPRKSIEEIMAHKQILKNAAIAKLTSLGLTEDEAKAIIG